MASAQGGYQGGYDDERFESPVPANFHCAICLNVLKQPMQCAKNEHFFCQQCITRHLAQFQRCPTCIEPLTIQTLRPARFVKDLISQLNIRCDNADRGCAEIVKLEILEGHVANCEFSPVQCPNDGCEVIISMKDQPNHEMNDCNFRQGKCEVCEENVAYGRRKLHCYVMKNEMDEMREEMRDEISRMKEIVMDMSKEFTRHMADMKDQMGEVKEQMGEVKEQMGEVKEQMGEVKEQITEVKEQMDNTNGQANDVRRVDVIKEMIQQDPEIASRGSLVTRSDENCNVREDIIIAGGRSGIVFRRDLKSVEKFCCSTRQWIPLSAMTTERYLSSSFGDGDQMFVCGGAWSGLDTIEMLELKEGEEWKELQTKLPQKTYGHASTVYEDNLFIFGGASGGKVVSDIYKVGLIPPYPSQLVSHLPEAISKHGAQRFGDKVAIVGGTTTGGYSGSLDKVLLYDITRNCCRALSPLPFAISGMASVTWGDNIIIIGGRDKEGNELNTVISYNIRNEKIQMLPLMKYERRLCTAVRTGNVIVVMGGLGKEGECLNSVESFSFDRYSWEELPSMNEKRHGATSCCCKYIL